MRIFHLIKKRVLAIALALVLFIPLIAVVDLSTTAKPVSADGETETVEEVVAGNLSDDNFAISDGMGTNSGLTTLQAEITLKNPALKTWLTDNRKNTAIALFTVYRDNGEGVGSAKFRICLVAATFSFIFMNKMQTKPVVLMFLQKIEYDDSIDFTTNDFFSIETADGGRLTGTPVAELDEMFLGNEYVDETFGKFTCIKVFSVWGNESCAGLFPYATVNGLPTFRFIFKTSSYTTNYFVGFEYDFDGGDGRFQNTLTSVSRSIFGILTNMREQGALEQEFTTETSLARAQSVLLQGVAQTAKIEYLEEIEGTYLAKKVSSTISVPIVDGRLASDDVATALKRESMRCQNANIRRFVWDENRDVWVAEYLSAVHLKTRTVDAEGHVMNMFLDLNKSYADYYADIGATVTNGEKLYEYMFNQLKNEYYPKLEGMTEDEIYGYFGQVWLPNNNSFASFNAAASALFNISTEELGFITSFEYVAAITYEQHNALMASYNYNWLKSTWEKVTDFVTGKQTTAKYYFFTAKPMEYVGISQTGGAGKGDDDGALGKVMRDPFGYIGDMIGDFFGFNTGPAGVIKRISSLLIVAGVVVGVCYLWRKVGEVGGVVSVGKIIAKKSKNSTKKSKKKK